MRRLKDIAYTPAGNGIGFGQRIAHYGALAHTGQRGKIGMLIGSINDMLVHLVGDHEGIVLHNNARNFHELLTAEHSPRGIGGIAQNKRLGPVLKGLLKLLRIEGKIGGMQGHIYGLGIT